MIVKVFCIKVRKYVLIHSIFIDSFLGLAITDCILQPITTYYALCSLELNTDSPSQPNKKCQLVPRHLFPYLLFA